MKLHSKGILERNLEFFGKFLPLERREASDAARAFFDLFYAKSCPPLVIANDLHGYLAPLVASKDSIPEIYSVILSCNSQNVDAFFRMNSFLSVISCFHPDLVRIPRRNLSTLVQILQSSVLYYLDSKQARQISKFVKVLHDGGLVSFHIEKCIQVVLRLYASKEVNRESASFSHKTLACLDTQNTFLLNQNYAITSVKRILSDIEWTRPIADILCEYQKSVLFLGRRKSGKSTLINTMLYRNKGEAVFNAVCPIEYCYGDDSFEVHYLSRHDLESMADSPNKQMHDVIESSLIDYEAEYTKQRFFYSADDLKDIYNTNKIQIAKKVVISKSIDLLKYVRFVNTTSIPSTTYRHLQMDEYVDAGCIVAYLISADSTGSELELDARYLCDVILRRNIQKVFVVFTKIDSSNYTLKKIKGFSISLKSIMEGLLTKRESANLNKIEVHYTAASIAYELRSNSSSDMDFDIYSSGLPEFEQSLFNAVFNVPSPNLDVSMLLKSVLGLLSNDNSSELRYDELSSIRSHISIIGLHSRDVGECLKSRQSRIHESISNLKDNLYYQMIDSLNFLIRNERRKSNTLHIRRLKKTTVDSLIVAISGLYDMLSLQDMSGMQMLKSIVSPDSTGYLSSFSKTSFHTEVLSIISSALADIDKDSAQRGSIIAMHFSNRLDLILDDEMKRTDFSDDRHIKPLKDAFDYYFLILQRSIDLLLSQRLKRFDEFWERSVVFLDCIFIRYFKWKVCNRDVSAFLRYFD